MNDYDNCQTLYLNLLRMTDANSEIPAVHYIREWNETKKCDGIATNFRSRRAAMREHLGDLTEARICLYEEDMKDENKALQYMVHFHRSNRIALLRALDIKNRLFYDPLYQFGMLSFGSLGVYGASRAYMKMRSRRP